MKHQGGDFLDVPLNLNISSYLNMHLDISLVKFASMQ